MEPELSAGSAENDYLEKSKRIEFKRQNDKDMAWNVKKLLHILTNYGMLYSNKVHGLRLVDMKEELSYGIL